MSRYQQAPTDGGYGQSYGQQQQYNQGYGQQGYGGSTPYQDDEYDDGYNKYAQGGAGAGVGAGAGGQYPMSSNNPYATSSSPRGYAPQKKSRKTMWIIIGVIAAIIVIVAAVVGGVLGSRHSSSSSSDPSSSTSGTSGDSTNFATGTAGATSGNTALPTLLSYWATNAAAETQTGANGEVYLAIATDTYMLPAYATGTATSGYVAPTTYASPAASDAWPADPSPPSNASIRAHPRLGAPQYKWDALTSGGLIANNPYLSYWNKTIVGNASATLNDAPEAYVEDGGLSGSGVLDVARRIKLKVKNWSYAYRVTNNTAYADRVWTELQTAAGNNSEVSFGADDGTRWNPAHFLDLAEFTNAFAIAYDWLYDIWTDDQKEAIKWSIINLGLYYGNLSLAGDSAASSYYWWTGISPGHDGDTRVNGNWNCVCNGGMILGALAIIDDDTTGIAQAILDQAVPDAQTNCFFGPWSDGTWAETTNYWYFGTTGAAEMVSALTTSYGDDRGLTSVNPGWELTSLFHIYAQGMTSLFNYGDHGPNKYSATANSLLLWGSIFDKPLYTLYQRDHYDASEPWSMFWYDPAVEGAWWDGLAIDHWFNSSEGQWATGRTSWTDNSGLFWAIKASELQHHQTHGDLDIGDFVLDALGQRWAGELGSGQYLSDGYFSIEDQNSERWLYYRKRTDGQNTLYIDYQNQNVNATPTGNYGSSGTTQGAAPYLALNTTDTSYFWTDMSSAYNYTVRRGIRTLNARRQVLLQDEISGVPSGIDVMWRMHTNATVTVDSGTPTVATLALGGQTLLASIVSGPSSAAFTTSSPAARLTQDPPVPTGPTTAEDGDQPNDGVTVLVIDMTADGTDTDLQVLFNPQWPDLSSSDYVSAPSVSLASWSLTSHN
ncbi:hypothetical protein Q5752_005451 [Cryptotrichosporon argae]